MSLEIPLGLKRIIGKIIKDIIVDLKKELIKCIENPTVKNSSYNNHDLVFSIMGQADYLSFVQKWIKENGHKYSLKVDSDDEYDIVMILIAYDGKTYKMPFIVHRSDETTESITFGEKPNTEFGFWINTNVAQVV